MVSQTILGMWLFTSLIYQGASMPLPNPDLKITYEFLDTGINTLHYYRKGEQGFCERRAAFEFSGQRMTQQVIWVNPKNAIWCDQDTDMQLGNRSWSDAWIEGKKFYLSIPLSEEEIIYVWDRVN